LNVAIIDAEIVGKNKHRFPNLACMKLSAYHKNLGNKVTLETSYKHLEKYDKVFISKVFTDTPISSEVLALPNIEYGGTGFFYDQAKYLPDEIEHIKPDYTLYDLWIKDKIEQGIKPSEFRFYKNYSIGFTTRGCFRGCYFCVNKNYKKSSLHSPVNEFIDTARPYILLLDDNVFACKDWRLVFESLQTTGKPFQYKQGLDERLLTKEKCEILFLNSKYNEDIIFAFDNIDDKEIIIKKLNLIKNVLGNKSVSLKFFLFCGSQNPNKHYAKFFEQDIIDLFERIKIISQYGCLPYIMRHKDYELSPYRNLYTAITSWCNQPSIFKKISFRDFCIQHSIKFDVYKQYKNNYNGYLNDGYSKGAYWRYMEEFESCNPEIANQYFDMSYIKLRNAELAIK